MFSQNLTSSTHTPLRLYFLKIGSTIGSLPDFGLAETSSIGGLAKVQAVNDEVYIDRLKEQDNNSEQTACHGLGTEPTAKRLAASQQHTGHRMFESGKRCRVAARGSTWALVDVLHANVAVAAHSP